MTARGHPSSGPFRLRCEVEAQPASVRLVRSASASLAEICGPEAAETVGLLVTELVGNAVRHAGLSPQDKIEVSIEVAEGGIRGSVKDRGRGFEIPAEGVSPRSDGGFGLYIVASLARRWGVSRSGAVTEVWFEL